MSAQKDCEFLVKRARELVSEDPCAAKAWLITARTLYPADFTIQVRAKQQSNVISLLSLQLPSLSITQCLIFNNLMYLSNISSKYEMYIIERNAERTTSAGRLLYDMYVNVNYHSNTYAML